MDELNKAVLKALASTYVYYFKAHGFHWNLKDKDFPQYHGFFGDIYDEVYDSIDSFAERIRTLQVDIPGALCDLIALSGIKEHSGPTPSKDVMVQELYDDGEALIAILRDAYNLCDIYSKFGFENFLAERIDAHEKHCWMLRSSM